MGGEDPARLRDRRVQLRPQRTRSGQSSSPDAHPIPTMKKFELYLTTIKINEHLAAKGAPSTRASLRRRELHVFVMKTFGICDSTLHPHNDEGYIHE